MKEKIILYTTHCPLCRGVEMLLKKHKIEYEEITDTDEIKKMGLTHVPVLSVGGNLLVGSAINKWINENK